MKKYYFFLDGSSMSFLLSSLAVHANELNKSDANIIGHVLDKSTKEHLSFYQCIAERNYHRDYD